MRTPLSRPRPARRARAAALATAFALVFTTLSGPANAQDQDPADPEAATQDTEALLATLALAPHDQPASPDDPFVDVVEADQIVRSSAAAQLRALVKANNSKIESVAADAVRSQTQVKAVIAQKVRDDAGKELSTERRRLSNLTVRAYVTGGDTDIDKYGDILSGDTTDPAAGRQIVFSQVLERQEEVTDTARRDLAVAKRKLSKARAVYEVAKKEAEYRARRAADFARRLADATQAHRDAVADAADARTNLRGASARGITIVPQEVALIGLPRLSAEDLSGWFARSAYSPRVSTPIEDYARWFIEEGNAEGIRGDIAFAQAVLETGGFANTDSVVANNFSGIGHCDLCPSGWKFASPHMGVRAQIQLLKSYAVKKPEYASDLVDKRLHGPAGCCPTWGDLTTVWATDPGYGPKVMLIYTSIVDYALQRRAAGEGLDAAAPTA